MGSLIASFISALGYLIAVNLFVSNRALKGDNETLKKQIRALVDELGSKKSELQNMRKTWASPDLTRRLRKTIKVLRAKIETLKPKK